VGCRKVRERGRRHLAKGTLANAAKEHKVKEIGLAIEVNRLVVVSNDEDEGRGRGLT